MKRLLRFSLIPRRGLRLRLTLLFGGTLGVTLLVFSFFVYSAFTREQDLLFDAALYNHAIDTAQGIQLSPLGEIVLSSDALSSGGKIFPFQVGKSFIQIRDRKGPVVTRSKSLGSTELPILPEDYAAMTSQGALLRTLDGKTLALPAGLREARYRMITYLFQPNPFSTLILQIAVSMKSMDEERRQLRMFFMIAIPVTLLLAMLAGLYVSGSALVPVVAITDQLRQISANQLNQRLVIPKDEEELQRLTLTLNELLNRLEMAFRSQERFVADASHQLRTPLAILQGELEVLQKKPDRSPEEIAEFLESAAQEIGYLSRIVHELLLLARADSGSASLNLDAVRLDEVVMETISRMEKWASRKQIRLKPNLIADDQASQNDFEVRGDSDLLQSAIQNLVDNAIKYSPENTTIEVRVIEKSDRVRVEVRDQGPGIPQEIRDRVYDRFFRAEDSAPHHSSRSRTPGFGLGLAIAHRIINAHDSQLELSPAEERGTVFHFEIKKV